MLWYFQTRMQLNVLKKAYTAKTSQLNQRSVESLDQVSNLFFLIIFTVKLLIVYLLFLV